MSSALNLNSFSNGGRTVKNKHMAKTNIFLITLNYIQKHVPVKSLVNIILFPYSSLMSA